jgi:glycosyltransferase involved in cell wall biosynthesis
MNSLISVIIPVYNTFHYFENCLLSIINQSYRNLEILVIDDCGSDGAIEIAKKYASRDMRIHIIHNDTNLGVSSSRNKGINHSKGEYLSFIDSDDMIDQDFYEKLLHTAVTFNADVVKADHFIVQDGLKIVTNLQKQIQKAIKNNEFVGIYYCHALWCSLIRRDIIVNNNIEFPNIKIGEDVVFLIKVLLNAKVFKLVDNVHYSYVDRDNSASKNITLDYYDYLMTHYEIIVESVMLSNLDDTDKIRFCHFAFVRPLFYHHLPLGLKMENVIEAYVLVFERVKSLMHKFPIIIGMLVKYPDSITSDIYYGDVQGVARSYIDSNKNISFLEAACASSGTSRSITTFRVIGINIITISKKNNLIRLKLLGVPVIKLKLYFHSKSI